KKILDEFYAEFRKRLQHAEQEGMRENPPTLTDIPCKLCGRPMMIRTGSTGVFLGCSGYSLPPKERCKGTMNLIHGSEVLDETEDAEVNALRSKHRCSKCGTAMEAYLLDEGRKLHICGNNPDCSGYEIEEGQFKLKGYDGPVLECDKCGSEMQLKTGRFGKFFACTNSGCGNTRKLLRNGQPAPPKSDPIPMPELKCAKHEDYFLLRDGAAGLFLAASQFPKHRETRAPLVSEILMAGKKLPEKYQHLLTAPVKDEEGNPAIVRFDRKTKEHYVATESAGKPTGWRANWENGKWVLEKSASKKKA
ncbi:MAG TPA: topoisomerase DNA-binding C4 zinc finger domain-containing protein, partial [Pseudomonadales bacterium]|nr:topoisomerase DNA-binding C4 zinc finger domain-containing protein [Pseudomonadales bacterium]